MSKQSIQIEISKNLSNYFACKALRDLLKQKINTMNKDLKIMEKLLCIKDDGKKRIKIIN